MTNQGIILLVEDNHELNIANSRVLRLRGYEVLTALTLQEAREKLSQAQPDIILLDVMLPDGDGFAFCKEIRDTTKAHILFLTAKSEPHDLIQGLSNGGDDYITKPFHPEELLARIAAAMRRRDMVSQENVKIIQKGSLVLDIVASRASLDDVDLSLTPREFSLLMLLVQNEDQILSAEIIYEKVWKANLHGDKNAVQAAISKLRHKLEHTGYIINFQRGRGYIFTKK
ncbi:MAG: response regulator transcription factor [Clostridiales bacterium]|nr:response regulator transcription factor [Clostridiales bacterium]